MPATLAPLSRRRFLALASAGVLVVRPAQAADADPHRIAFLSDPHIPEKAETKDRDCNMTDRLKRVADEVAKLEPRPICAVIDGDLAHKTGTLTEYAAFGKLVEPIRVAGIPLHLTLGNHDHFGRFAEAMDALRPKDRPVDGKQVLVVELERANLFILDSFDPRNPGGGILGAEQLKWLASAPWTPARRSPRSCSPTIRCSSTRTRPGSPAAWRTRTNSGRCSRSGSK